MPSIGQPLAPPPSDLDEILTTAAPLDSTIPFDPSMESAFTGRAADPRGRPSTIQHLSTATVTLYDIQGEDRSVTIEDLALLVSTDIEPHNRLYTRCPKCRSQPNGGIHPFAGPNGCPKRASQKFMTCPICASYGRSKRVYAGEPARANAEPGIEDDPNYVAPELPNASSETEQLQDKLYQHMTAFHSAETQQQYGIRREPNGNSFRIVRGRS